MKGNHFCAVFRKQWCDTWKNKTILIQFFMFPVLAVIMENSVKMEGMPEHFFVNLFAVMYVGMAPLTGMASIISEEKEKNTLRVLLQADVTPGEYLLGIGSLVFLGCMAGGAVFAVTGGYSGRDAIRFLLLLAFGILVSAVLGAGIGTFSKNQMSATSITVPVMLIVSFLPMLSMFNTHVEKVAKYTYSGQLYLLMQGWQGIGVENVVIVLGNFLLGVLFFGYAYKRCGLA